MNYIYIYKLTCVLHTLWLDKPHFLLEYRDIDDVTKSRKNKRYFIKQIENSFRVSVVWQKQEWHHLNWKNTGKHSATRNWKSVEMTSFMFLSQYRDTQAIFYLLNTNIWSSLNWKTKFISWRFKKNGIKMKWVIVRSNLQWFNQRLIKNWSRRRTKLKIRIRAFLAPADWSDLGMSVWLPAFLTTFY